MGLPAMEVGPDRAIPHKSPLVSESPFENRTKFVLPALRDQICRRNAPGWYAPTMSNSRPGRAVRPAIWLLSMAPLGAPAMAAPAEVLGLSTQDQEHSPPAMFRDLDFPGALAAGKAESKLVLLDAMTSWCGPCKVMDATTWVDPTVIEWIAANAVAVQLDMDVHESVKTSLGVKAFPTMVLLRPNGSEFDRVVGLRTPEELMTWLRGAESGTREIDRVRAQMKTVASHPTGELRERAALASAAASLGALREAEEFALWLWEHEPENEGDQLFLSSWRYGRGRSLTADLLKGGSPSFARAIAAEITRREARLVQSENVDLRAEWIALQRASDNDKAVARWASILAVDPAGREILMGQGDTIFDLLVDQGQWAAAGHSLKNPLSGIRFQGDNLGAYDVKPEGSPAEPKDAPKSVPMIPMGGMKPATQPASAPAQEKAKSIPAIPLGGMKPALKRSDEGSKKGKTQAMPAIPMGSPNSATGDAKPARPMAKSDEEIATEIRERLTHQLRRTAARRYAALHAAARTAEADAAAALLMQYANDNASRAALVGCAIRAGQLSTRIDTHVEWLDDIARGAVR